MDNENVGFGAGLSRRQFMKIAAVAGLGTASYSAMMPHAFAAYPSQQISLLIGYAAGGTGDIIARLIAQDLFASSGKSVVENLPGASGNIAAQRAADAAPDGYTLLLGNNAEIAINSLVMESMAFDPASLVPVAMAYASPHAIAVSVNSPYQTLEDLLADARANPGKVKYATAGRATPGHLAGEKLGHDANVKIVHVPYKGTGQAIADVIGGHVDCYIPGLPGSMQFFDANQIRYLAIAAADRLESLPDVPTVAEITGVDFDFQLWGGVFAPPGTPADIVEALNGEVNAILRKPETQAKLKSMHIVLEPKTSAEFSDFVSTERDKYKSLVAEHLKT